MIPKRPPRPSNEAENWAAYGMAIFNSFMRGRWYPKLKTPMHRLTDEPRPEIFDEPKQKHV